jgi:hypothetical protein
VPQEWKPSKVADDQVPDGGNGSRHTDINWPCSSSLVAVTLIFHGHRVLGCGTVAHDR